MGDDVVGSDRVFAAPRLGLGELGTGFSNVATKYCLIMLTSSRSFSEIL